MTRAARAALVISLIAALGAAVWWYTQRSAVPQELTLYGNVDLREIDLAFNNNERIASVLVQEGDRVHPGQLVARLDTSRLTPQLQQAQAQLAAQQANLDKMRRGNRPQDIAQARANVAAARAEAADAAMKYQRLLNVSGNSGGRAVSPQDVDDARFASDQAEAKVAQTQAALDLELAGYRREDIDQAVAQTAAAKAQVDQLQRQLHDADLFAPENATVDTRVLEPGDMASPARPVLTLAVTDPKWVRVYVDEPNLGFVHPGMAASVTVDSFPNRMFGGQVGFVSPVAEFTPKNIETQELRTNLVYEVRVLVSDPRDELRLGMPATVHLPLRQPAAAPQPAPAPQPGPGR
jgi:HlyD family secretion protein